MQVSNELLEKAYEAESAEELLEMAKENGIDISLEEAIDFFEDIQDELNDSEELSEKELDNVVAASQCRSGKTYSSDSPYYLITTAGNTCPSYHEVDADFGVKGTCCRCYHAIHKGVGRMVTYCTVRTIDNDPYR